MNEEMNREVNREMRYLAVKIVQERYKHAHLLLQTIIKIAEAVTAQPIPHGLDPQRELSERISAILPPVAEAPLATPDQLIEEPAPVEPSLNSLESLTPEQLLLALKDNTSEQARQEIHRRIDSNLATKLAVRYLLAADHQDGIDAFYSLGDLVSVRVPSCKRESVSDFVFEYFAPYHYKSDEQILAAALDHKFRYIGESLTPAQLAELAASNPEMLPGVRAEVCLRLKDDPRKANFLTFRWLMPADDEDKADAFNGLERCCWKETKYRNRRGLFPRGYAETYLGEIKREDKTVEKRAGGIAEETREAIMDALVDRLYDLRTLSAPEIVLQALCGAFQTDADVAEALRRKVRERSGYLFQYGSDAASKESTELTLFEVMDEEKKENPPNVYSNTVEFILQEKSQVVEEVGEEGWEVIEQIVELVDNDLLPKGQKERQRVLTEVFQTAYSVNPRQARTLKSRFLAAIETAATLAPDRKSLDRSKKKAIFEAVAQLFDWLGCRYDRCRYDWREPQKSTPKQLRAQSDYSPPVAPMEVIRRTSGMPIITYWNGERSSVGRDVPPDEWQEIKARLNRKRCVGGCGREVSLPKGAKLSPDFRYTCEECSGDSACSRFDKRETDCD